MAAESREAPAADVSGSNTIQVCRFPPAPSFCHLTGRPEFRGEQNDFGECSSEDTDEMMGFQPRSVIYSIFRHLHVPFILFEEQKMNQRDIPQNKTN